MLLQDLVEHADIQATKINEHASCFTNASDRWTQLRGSLWGKGLEFLELSSRDIRKLRLPQDKDPLPNVTPTTHPVVQIPETMPNLWDLAGQRHILVRSEYKEAESATLLANSKGLDLFLVTGQPGIGKTVFFIWLLMCRLVLKLPTILQVEKDKVLLFHEGGVLRFLHPDKPSAGLEFPRSSPCKVWALVDSSPRLPNPAPILSHGLFVVYTIHPRVPSFVSRVPPGIFCMKMWTLPETIQGRPFLGLADNGPHTSRQLHYLYDTYAASPRDLSIYGSCPEKYEDLVDSQARAVSPDILRLILQPSEFRTTFHLVTVIEPSPDSRSICRKRIASRRAFEILWGCIKHRVSDLRSYYDLYRHSLDMTCTLGWIFELRIHDLLKQGGPVRLLPIYGYRSEADPVSEDHITSKEGGHQKVIQLPESGEHFLVEGDQLRVGQYYRLRAADFSSIDSLFFIHPHDEPSPILLAFQIRHNAVCDINEEDLRRVNGLNLPHTNVRKFFVLVTPNDIQPGIEALNAFSEGTGGQRDMDQRTPGMHWQAFRQPVSMVGLFP